MSNIKLTIAMAHHSDYMGLFATIQALRLYQDLRDCEILVVDNDSTGKHGIEVANFCNSITPGETPITYVPFAESTGTTQTREALFSHAQGEAVLVMDCHVMLQAGAIARLKAFYDAAKGTPDALNLYTGPLLMDNFGNAMSHFEPVWRSEMWGVWGVAWTNPEGKLVTFSEVEPLIVQPPAFHAEQFGQWTVPRVVGIKALNTNDQYVPTDVPWAGHEAVMFQRGYRMASFGNTPFEIPAQGLGMFTCMKDAWLGFNPNFRGFGGEECYIHEKYRQAGRKTICLPWMKWNHRFARPDGVKYPLTKEHKLRNYVLGHLELGLDLTPVHHHFVNEIKIPQSTYDAIVADPVNAYSQTNNIRTSIEPVPATASQPITMTSNNGWPLPVGVETLAGVAEFIAGVPRDLNEHAGVLMQLASQCNHVTEVSTRRESTAFLLAGVASKACKGQCQKATCDREACAYGTLVSFQAEKDTLMELLSDVRELHNFELPPGGRQVDWELQAIDINTMPDVGATDMLFLDSVHHAERFGAELKAYAPLVKRYIVFHDSVSHGINGENGAGMFEALKPFLEENPEWFVASAYMHQYGLVVLSRDERDRPSQKIMLWPKGCGVGTEIKKSLKLIGIEASAGCACNALAIKYDAEGPQWCRDNIEEILDNLKEQADARQMGFAFVRPVVRLMVMRCIRQAEKNIKNGTCA
jgi:hypothetical protein